ncbi:preprotein translocase subunit SecY [Aeoliella sp. ICT_H6.2]|uniref:Protein translocase subunit SecY n=1 Tax=Aeoliella straminimaris TaxID=2954799 RepID=A0A9X2FBW8_9BACT|nr:preprotein translocase subunit SecY [Aeoliella straminimaris]MCO6046070.1 preprotein translocase subunit SecY [Aeoliella straminimaris]
MWKKLRVVWTIPELRSKILFTIGMLAVYRLGFQIRLPFIDPTRVNNFGSEGGLGQLLATVSTFSGAGLDQITIFGLGIMPYISASIIFQLLGSVIPSLERLQKEGETGRKKINEYTRYATVALCVFQSWFFLRSFVVGQGFVDQSFLAMDANGNPYLPLSWQLVAVATMTCGTVFLMWIGEQIDEYGIGNGISLIIMAGILANMPAAGWNLLQQFKPELGTTNGIGPEKLLLLAAMFVAVVVGVVFITLGQRRIPMQSAKHIRGRRAMGGQKSYLPLKVNQAGVMPIIFASSLLIFPKIVIQQVNSLLTTWPDTSWLKISIGWLLDALGPDKFFYNLCYLLLIYFFCYFWTAITFNPKDMADNLKNFGSFIPGYRPGKRTADYLEKVMIRITYVGAGFLALIAIIPTVISEALGVDYMIAMFYGGTSLLIAVSVAFDLVQKIDSHLVMRNYKGLLEGN